MDGKRPVKWTQHVAANDWTADVGTTAIPANSLRTLTLANPSQISTTGYTGPAHRHLRHHPTRRQLPPDRQHQPDRQPRRTTHPHLHPAVTAASHEGTFDIVTATGELECFDSSMIMSYTAPIGSISSRLRAFARRQQRP